MIALIVIFGRLLYFNLMLKQKIASYHALSSSDRIVMLISSVFVIILVLVFPVALFFILRFTVRAFKACVNVFLWYRKV